MLGIIVIPESNQRVGLLVGPPERLEVLSLPENRLRDHLWVISLQSEPSSKVDNLRFRESLTISPILREHAASYIPGLLIAYPALHTLINIR